MHTSCVGNQLPRALPRVLTLNELSRRLLSETSNLLLVSHQSSSYCLLSRLHFPLSTFKKGTCFLSITLLLTAPFCFCVLLCLNQQLFMLLFFFLYPTHIQLSKKKQSTHCFTLFPHIQCKQMQTLPLHIRICYAVQTNLAEAALDVLDR